MCNECDFKTKSLGEMKRHKDTQHQPDDYHEESAFKKLFYDKIWRVRGKIDPLSALQVYKPKIKSTIQHYLNEKGAMKWHIGMRVIMKKMDYTDDGKQVGQFDPGFTSKPRITAMMFNFDEGYNTAREKIEKNFVQMVLDGFLTELILYLYILRAMTLHHKKLPRKKQMRENKDKKSLRKFFNL
jgi:hypothetical protein